MFQDCVEQCVGDDSYSPTMRDTVRKEHLEYHRSGVLVAVAFRYTRAEGSIRFSPKMLLIDGVRHCC